MDMASTIIAEIIEQMSGICCNVLKKCESEFLIGGNMYAVQLPSGDGKYSMLWTRDASMMTESGMIGDKVLKGWIDIIIQYGQNTGDDINLPNGCIIPSFAVMERINSRGAPAFFSSVSDQRRFGKYPPHDNQYYFIEIVFAYIKKSGDYSILNKATSGITLIERLDKTFESYNIDRDTNLCYSKGIEGEHTIDWGFCDIIVKGGLLLFPSILRYRAACRMKYFYEKFNNSHESKYYDDIAIELRQNIVKTFYDGSGWLNSATEYCCQHDVWGTAFAIWNGILKKEEMGKSIDVLNQAYLNGDAVYSGYVRHILRSDDYSGKSSWEYINNLRPYGTYQDGGYWSIPSGWYAYALSLKYNENSVKLLKDFLKHTKENLNIGAPFEWINEEGNSYLQEIYINRTYSAKNYGPSISLPYKGLLKITS